MLGSRNLGTIFNNDIFNNPFFEEVSQEPEQIETTSSLSDDEKQDVLIAGDNIFIDESNTIYGFAKIPPSNSESI